MRSSILFASVLAAGALAGPVDLRALKTVDRTVATVEVEVHVKVDRNGKPYTTETVGTHAIGGVNADKVRPTTHCSKASTKAPIPTTTSTPPPPPPPAPTTYRAAPTSTSKAYQPPPAPTTTPVYVPPPPPSTTQAPPPKPTTTQPAPAPAPSSAVEFGVTHKSGEIQATFSSGVDYQNAVLWHHNRARANHGASNLEWSEDCVAGAQKAADTCVFAHLTTEGQGQNLYAVSGDASNVTSGITEAFYKAEADMYNFWGQEPDMTNFHDWGHLTQVVWKGTTHVGCVTVNCPGMATNRYTVCNYSPPGNYEGQYAENVVAPAASYHGYSWLD